MKLGTRTTLGADISGGLISLAMLKRGAKGVEPVATASGPVPEGAIDGRVIADPAALTRAVSGRASTSRFSNRRFWLTEHQDQ